MSTKPEEILKMLTDDVVATTQSILQANGLSRDSDLFKSIDVDVSQRGIQLIALDYYEFVSQGRRRGARKVPIEDLVAWIKERNIRPRVGQSVNSLAFAIQTSIFRNGIQPKNYIRKVNDSVLDVVSEEFTELLSEMITKDLQENIQLN